jgi:hypothetical protein
MTTSSRKLAMYLAGCTLAVVVVVLILMIATGASQEQHEHVKLPEPYALGLLAHANELRVLMALDVAFIVLFTAFFAALAQYLRLLGRPFVTLALATMVGVAVLDFVEDQHIISLLDYAENRVLPTASSIVFQSTLSWTKWSLSYLSLFMFGLAIPRSTRLGLVFSLFFTVGSLLSGVVGLALPPEKQASLEIGHWIGFVFGFVLAIAWLLKSKDAEPSAPLPGTP